MVLMFGLSLSVAEFGEPKDPHVAVRAKQARILERQRIWEDGNSAPGGARQPVEPVNTLRKARLARGYSQTNGRTPVA